jgi:hypothetical protein
LPQASGALPVAEVLDALPILLDSGAQGQVLHPTIADSDDFVSMGIFVQHQLDWLRF